MAQQVINIGSVANDRTGDTWRDAMDKSNDNFTELYGLTNYDHRVVVNSLSDLPTPVSNVITLDAETQYFFANDVDLGSNRLVLSDLTSVSGLESINIAVSSTTTGDLFSGTDVTCRVSSMTISCPNGRVFSFSEATGKIMRFNDLTILSCNKLGSFTGTTGVIRMTNVSPASITSDGIEFSGNFRSFLYDVSACAINAGALFKLGTATFDSFITDTVLVTLNGSSNFLNGAAASANINSGGLGTVSRTLTSGTGTPLSGISVTDDLWEFVGNDDIQDSRSDGLSYMQSNATATTITVAGTYVLIAGTWTVDSVSQFAGTAAGRLTYNGTKPIRVPITASLSVEPTAGTNKTLACRIAVNGTTIAGSTRTARTDAGSPVSITDPWQTTLDPGDYVEVFVTNTTDTNDVLVSSAILRVN